MDQMGWMPAVALNEAEKGQLPLAHTKTSILFFGNAIKRVRGV